MSAMSTGTVLARFDAVAAATPAAPAVIAGCRTVSYAELAHRSGRVAGALAQADSELGTLAVVPARRSVDYVASLFGCWRAGYTAVPVDLTQPPHRLAAILERSGARLVVGERDSADPDLTWVSPGVSATAGSPQRPESGTAGSSPRPAGPGQAAYVMHTSGSTGVPKGVVVPHRGLCHTMDYFGQRDALRGRTVLSAAAFTFDLSLLETFVPLTSGGTLVIASESERADPDAVAGLIERHGVEWVMATPTWTRLLEWANARCLRGLGVFSIGETLDAELAQRLRGHGCHVWNSYGPTEASVASTMHVVTAADRDEVPIGQPIDGVTVVIRDPDGGVCPPGEVGELWMSGPTVATGYLNDPASTSRSFHRDPDLGWSYRTGDFGCADRAGQLWYRGRADDQVKVSGHRIELGEIEAAAQAHPSVERAAAVVVERAAGERVLTLFVEGTELTRQAVNDHLQTRLPAHMLPGPILTVDRWPVNTNGKTDRGALRRAVRSSHARPLPAHAGRSEPT